MYNPLDDPAYNDGPITTCPFGSGRRIVRARGVFCACCGSRLTLYTWRAIEEVGFCTSCAVEYSGLCLHALTYLGGTCWDAIIIPSDDMLWLAPVRGTFRGHGILIIRSMMAFERQYGPLT